MTGWEGDACERFSSLLNTYSLSMANMDIMVYLVLLYHLWVIDRLLKCVLKVFFLTFYFQTEIMYKNCLKAGIDFWLF